MEPQGPNATVAVRMRSMVLVVVVGGANFRRDDLFWVEPYESASASFTGRCATTTTTTTTAAAVAANGRGHHRGTVQRGEGWRSLSKRQHVLSNATNGDLFQRHRTTTTEWW